MNFKQFLQLTASRNTLTFSMIVTIFWKKHIEIFHEIVNWLVINVNIKLHVRDI